MADFVIPENVAAVIGTVVTAIGGAAAGVCVYVYRAKEAEIKDLRAKVDSLQGEIKTMLFAQIENEPARKAALDKIGSILADNDSLLRDALRSKAA